MNKNYYTICVAILLAMVMVPVFAAGTQESAKEEMAHQGSAKMLWWSHWANEPSKVELVERIVSDYQLAHPGVEIELVWWDKTPLKQAWRTAMTAGGTGAPDIVTDPAGDTLTQVKAGWFLPLGDNFPWQNYETGVKEQGSVFDGKAYKYNIGKNINMILYNPEIFKESGISVPADYTFTGDEYVDIVKKVQANGYAGTANAIGNRPYPALYPIYDALFALVGKEKFYDYVNGNISWDTPEVRQVLNWSVNMRDAGLWPKTFSSMTIDEFHVYFHTQKKAAMLFLASWYTGRAFKPVEKGGQSPNFQFKLLRYPKLEGAKNNNRVVGGFESGYMISSATKQPEIARDILSFAAQPKYGALWVTKTDIPTCIKYKPSDISKDIPPSKWEWYHQEVDRVYGSLPVDIVMQLNPPERTGAFKDAFITTLNQGLPLGLITVDEAIKKLDENRKQ